MTMRKTCYISIFLIILSFSCSKDIVKPSADSLITTEVIGIIDVIKNAYESKHEIVLQNHMDSLLAGNIVKYLYFENANLVFTPRLVRLTDESVTVNLNWQGTWKFDNDNEVTKSGVGNLVFHKETMKLTSIEGDNPFLTPAIRK